MKKESALMLFLAGAVLAMILLPFAMGAGKVDPLLGAFRQNDVDSTSVPVQSVTGTDPVVVTTSGTVRAVSLQNEHGTTIDGISTNTGLASDSDTELPTVKAVKAYSDALSQARHFFASTGSAMNVQTGAVKLISGASSTYHIGSGFQNPGALNDAFTIDVPSLATGVYDMVWIGRKSSNRGIQTLYWDGTPLITIDWYDAGDAQRQLQSITFTNTTAGSHTLLSVAATKHASSTGYYITNESIEIRPN